MWKRFKAVDSLAVNIKFSSFKIKKNNIKKKACHVRISLLIIVIVIYLDKKLNLDLDFDNHEEDGEFFCDSHNWGYSCKKNGKGVVPINI